MIKCVSFSNVSPAASLFTFVHSQLYGHNLAPDLLLTVAGVFGRSHQHSCTCASPTFISSMPHLAQAPRHSDMLGYGFTRLESFPASFQGAPSLKPLTASDFTSRASVPASAPELHRCQIGWGALGMRLQHAPSGRVRRGVSECICLCRCVWM